MAFRNKLLLALAAVSLLPVALGQAAECKVRMQAFDVRAKMIIRAGSAQEALEILIPIPGVNALAICDGVEYSVRGVRISPTGKVYEHKKRQRRDAFPGDWESGGIDINGNRIW